MRLSALLTLKTQKLIHFLKTNLFKIFIIVSSYMCVWACTQMHAMCVCVKVHSCHGVHVEIWGQLLGVSSLLLRFYDSSNHHGFLAGAFTCWGILLSQPCCFSHSCNRCFFLGGGQGVFISAHMFWFSWVIKHQCVIPSSQFLVIIFKVFLLRADSQLCPCLNNS